MSAQNHLNILSCENIDQECIINLTKDNINSFKKEKKEKCRIIKFESDWSFEEVVVKIPSLDVKDYPLLFIFTINIKSDNFPGSIKFLKTSLEKFIKNRSLILQLSSEIENSTKIYYKDENYEDFCEIDGESSNSEEISDFASFIKLYLNGKIDNVENVMLEKLPEIKNSSLIQKFINSLNFSNEFYDDLVLKCARCGSKSDLIAVIDAYYDEKGNINGPYLKYFLSYVKKSTSVLHTAVQNSNQLIVKFLLQKCSFWIQQLPFDHQIEISTAAYKSGQLKIFCDLIESHDFPFPKEFDPEPIVDKRFRRIISDRVKFHEDLLEENLSKIDDFIEVYPELKFAFNFENKSAIGLALESKKFRTFTYLKANDFRDNEIENISIGNLTEEEDKTIAKHYAFVQLKNNVRISSFDEDISVYLLATKSLIYCRDVVNPLEQEQRKKIKEWYREIYKTKFGSKLTDTAVQCQDLKIIFDFECASTGNVDVLSIPTSSGVTYPVIHWIFIGAKLDGTKQRDQRIKGVIAHELCHYVMSLVYKNNDYPYYADNAEHCAEFEDIADEIKSMLFPKQKQEEVNEQNIKEEEEQPVGSNEENVDNSDKNEEPIDDKCEGIISTVYTLYDKKDRHPELIVRPAQIQAQFDDNEDKLKELEEFYQKLFKFFEDFVLPEIRKFSLQNRRFIQCFNDYIGILCDLKDSNIKLLPKISISEVLKVNPLVLTTNVPKLLLLDIYNQLNEKYKYLMDVKNIFITPQNLEKSSISIKFNEIVKAESDLNIFVDFTKGFGTNHEINLGEHSKLILMTLKDQRNDELLNKITKKNTSQIKITINYNWKDLTAESQKHLLQNKINFQNNLNFSFSDLILNEIGTLQEESTINEDLSDTIDDQLLNLLLEKSEIKVNQPVQENTEHKKFKILFQTRNLVKKYKVTEKLQTLDDTQVNKTRHSSMKDVRDDNTDAQHELAGRSECKDNNENSKLTKGLVGKGLEQFREIDKTEEMTQQQMLEDVKDKKFVLISDKAGSGKSWILKNFSNELSIKHPNKWITYVDLKQYIPVLKPQDIEIKFVSFMVKNILTSKTNLESGIFKKLYENGKVCILFDGFDEIAPDCAEFVTKLFQSFQQNNGNQLWIATRDYFEVDLKEKLELNAVFKLDEFTEEHGDIMIASSWILGEIKDNFDKITWNEIKNVSNFESYKEIAKMLRKKYLDIKTSSIGLPQYYKMIADVFENDKFSKINLNMLKVYIKFVNIQYQRWANGKGELRMNDSIESQHKNFNYHQVHEVVAMESLFTEDSTICGLSVKDSGWFDLEIVDCGMLTKVGEKFLFSHETLREYYAASFVIRKLTMRIFDDGVCKYFISFLSIQKFGIVRMFLNDALSESSNVTKISSHVTILAQYSCQNAEKLKDLHTIFEEKLEHLAKFLIQIIGQIESYEQKRIILFNNRKMFGLAPKILNIFYKLKEFVFNFFTIDDLKEFLLSSSIIHSILSSELDVENLETFLDEICMKTEDKYVGKLLQIKDGYGENLFHSLVRSEFTNEKKFLGVLKIISEYLKNGEKNNLIRSHNKREENCLHFCFNLNEEAKIKLIFSQLEQIFMQQNLSDKFREMLCEKTSTYQHNILHLSTFCNKIEFHESVWQLLLNTFENREDLKDLIMQRDEDGNNFVHYLVFYNKPEIVDFIIKKVKENFSDNQYEKILKSKGQFGRNLLQLAASNSKDIKTHQILWKFFRDFCKSDEEFLEFLKKVNNENSRVIHIAAAFTSKEIFEFMINEIEKIASNNELKNILRTLGKANTNLLQSATIQNKSVELHEYLWTTIKQYFNSQEILDMIKHADENGNNLLMFAVEFHTKEVLELTWTKIKNIFDTIENTFKIQDYLRHKYILFNLIKGNDSEKLKFLWPEMLKYFTKQQFQKLLSQRAANAPNVLHYAAKCDKIEFQETFWELLLKTYENRDELKDLIMQENQYGYNFVHLLFISNKPEVIDFTIKKIKENLSDNQYEEILKSKGEFERNLLQLAACSSKEIFEFMINEIEKVISNEEIKNILRTLGMENKNLLQSAARVNKSVGLHEYLWTTLKKYFNSQEILDMIKHADKNGDNLLIYAVECNTKEILELTWTEIKNIFDSIEDTFGIQDYLGSVNKNQENIFYILIRFRDLEKFKFFWTELLKYFTNQQFKDLFVLKTEDGENVFHYASKCDQIEFHETLWELLLNTFEDRVELKDLIMQRNQYGNNFAHLIFISNKPEIIDFTINRIKENFSKDQYEEILKSKGFAGRNLIHKVACSLKDIKTYQMFWRIFRDFCNSDEEFLEILKGVDNENNNIFHLAACFTSKEIFEFMIDEIEKIASNNELKNILRTLGLANKNLLQSAARVNKSVELHEYLWTTIKKYFNSKEILDLIKHTHEDGYNLLMNAIACNTKEILELTWTEIKNIFDKTENISKFQDYLMSVDRSQKNILHFIIIRKDSEKIKFLWKELLKYFTNHQLKELLSQKAEDGKNVLHYAAKGDKIEFHETLWKLLLNTYENREALKDLIMQGDKDGDNFVHYLVFFNKSDIIDFTIKKFRENLNDNQYEKILKSKGQVGRNLLQTAACSSNDIKTHQILWKIFRDFCKSDEEFFEFLKEVNDQNCNIFQIASAFTSKEIFEFMINEIEKIASNEEIKNILKALGLANRNLLQLAARQNKSVKLHKYLFVIVKKYLNISEILGIIQHTDVNGNNLLFDAIQKKCTVSVHLIWNELHELIISDRYCNENLLKKFSECEEFLAVLLNDPSDENLGKAFKVKWDKFIKEYELYNFDILSAIFSEEQFQEILRSKGKLDRNLLQVAAINTKNVDIFQMLWKILEDSCSSNQEFLEYLKQYDVKGSKTLHISASSLTAEILDFMIENLEKITSKSKIKILLTSLGYGDGNIVHVATAFNKSLELHKKLWEIIQKYFSSSRILEMINYCDRDGDNIFHNAVYWNTKEIAEFTWTQIKSFIQTKEDQTKYLNRKGHESHNLLKMSEENQSKDPEVRKWVKNLMDEL